MNEGLATVNNHAVVLNEGIIKKYICPNATETEVYMFLQLCKAQNLNPFLREAYLIKYGTTPATIVTGKDTFIKRARGIQQYRGFKAGIIVISNKAVVYREGGMLIKGEELIGGWAEVYRSDLEVPVRAEVTFDEYVGKKKIYENNKVVGEEINAQWSSKPATMIRKVALVQAHREAFPDQFEGMYSPEEMGVEVETIEYTQDKPAEGYKPPVKPPQEKKPEIKDPDSPASEAQIKAVHTMYGKLGLGDDLIYAYCSEAIGIDVPIKSTKDLTKGQASAVIEKLNVDIAEKKAAG
jgi:phage recombination protein Bet